VNDLHSYFEVSKPFRSFLGVAFAVQVEQKWWQTPSLRTTYKNKIQFSRKLFSLLFPGLHYMKVDWRLELRFLQD